jgi:hypothetical protein
MKRFIMFMVMAFALVAAVFAGGNVDVSTITPQDVARLEKIVDDLEPTKAINTAMANFGNNAYPMLDYMKIQTVKINAIFNEYGIVYNQFIDYTTSDPKLNVLLARLKSRFSYLNGIITNNKETLKKTLDLL